MALPEFDYVAAKSLEEASGLMVSLGSKSRAGRRSERPGTYSKRPGRTLQTSAAASCPRRRGSLPTPQ